MLLAAAANASLPCTRERFAAREATAGWPAGCLSIVTGVGRRLGRREQSRFSLSSTPGWRPAGACGEETAAKAAEDAVAFWGLGCGEAECCCRLGRIMLPCGLPCVGSKAS